MVDELARSNISQLLGSFDTFVRILEDPAWTRTASMEDIKVGFKLGSFVEKTITDFDYRNILRDFISILQDRWKTRGRTKMYNTEVFKFACDELLRKFFSCVNVPDHSLDVAIRIYTSIYPRERLQEVITKLLLSAGTYEAIYDFLSCIPEEKTKPLTYHQKLIYWDELVQIGKENDVKSEVEDMLTPYRVETNLHLLIGVLSLTDCSDSNKKTQTIALSCILDKMLDRTVFVKTFWLTLLRIIDKEIVCNTCKNFDSFLKSFINFIVYAGSMMIRDNGEWRSEAGISICPEITYAELLKWLHTLCDLNSEMKNFILTRIGEARQHTENVIWDDFSRRLMNDECVV